MLLPAERPPPFLGWASVSPWHCFVLVIDGIHDVQEHNASSEGLLSKPLFFYSVELIGTASESGCERLQMLL